MIDRLTENFNFRETVLRVREERQRVLSANIANADTPHYKARDIDFRSALSRAAADQSSAGSLQMNTTSDRHIGAGFKRQSREFDDLLYRVPSQPSMDGNTVDMERERAQFADNSVRYQASLTFMKSYIQGLKGAMRPAQ